MNNSGIHIGVIRIFDEAQKIPGHQRYLGKRDYFGEWASEKGGNLRASAQRRTGELRTPQILTDTQYQGILRTSWGTID